MAMSTVARMAGFLLLGFACVPPTALAEDVTTATMQEIPGYLNDFAMTLSLTPSESAPVPYECRVAPLTPQVGLNQTNEITQSVFDVRGNMVIVDLENFNTVDIAGAIAYMSCDSNSQVSNIPPSQMLNTIMVKNPKPKAILLYSTDGNWCSLDGDDPAFQSIWTMTDPQDAWMVKNVTWESTGTVLGTISGDTTSDDSASMGQQGGSNSAVAMSILYSITGLITVLFLIIIITGAIRAHRNPERYGPRAGSGGRPRQSRARGLARAVLDTIPVIKFGDPQPGKPDLENELEDVSGDRQRAASPQHSNLSPNTADQPRPSTGATSAAGDRQAPNSATVAAPTEEDQGDAHAGEAPPGCSICTDDFAVGQDVRVLPCDHKFHPACVDPWLINVSGTCPLCRLDLRPPEVNVHVLNSPTAHQTMSDEDLSAPPPVGEAGEMDSTQRRRRSRLLDWNRLRHASVDERIHALRQYRQS